MLSLFIFQPEKKNNVMTVNVHLYILCIIFSPRILNKLYIHRIEILSAEGFPAHAWADHAISALKGRTAVKKKVLTRYDAFLFRAVLPSKN